MTQIKHQNVCSKKNKLSDEDVYLMFMLHQHQHVSSEKLARRFGITAAQVRDIIARRANSGCCG